MARVSAPHVAAPHAFGGGHAGHPGVGHHFFPHGGFSPGVFGWPYAVGATWPYEAVQVEDDYDRGYADGYAAALASLG